MMERQSIRCSIPGRHGALAAILDRPVEEPLAFGVFAHCFTCTKDLKAIVKISRHLATLGWAVLRFDFAGLGNSEGEFSDTTFQDNLSDVRSTMEYVSKEYEAPRFLMGHSLGGSAMMATAMEFDSVEAVSVIASPSDTRHLADTIHRLNPAVEEQGEGMVNTGTYEYLIKKHTVDELRRYDLPAQLGANTKRILVFHSPADKTLGMEHAFAIADKSGGPVSIVDLENANHLMTNDARDCEFIAESLASWLKRYLV